MLKNPYVSNILLINCDCALISRISKLGVDGPVDLSIIRPTSGADETENSLIIKELDKVSGEEGLRFSYLNRQR